MARLESSKDILKLVTKVLEDEDVMDELIQLEIDEINDYISIKYTILAVEDLIKEIGKDITKKIKADEHINVKINKFTGFQAENVFLTKSDLKRILINLKCFTWVN